MWALGVLANHPGAAEQGISRLTHDPNFGTHDRDKLAGLLHRLGADPGLVQVVDPEDPPTPHATGTDR
jgi:hypothetical protein